MHDLVFPPDQHGQRFGQQDVLHTGILSKMSNQRYTLNSNRIKRPNVQFPLPLPISFSCFSFLMSSFLPLIHSIPSVTSPFLTAILTQTRHSNMSSIPPSPSSPMPLPFRTGMPAETLTDWGVVPQPRLLLVLWRRGRLSTASARGRG